MEKQVVLIAGGTGLIGQEIKGLLERSGHEIRILSRKPSDHTQRLFHWDPAQKEMDHAALEGVTTIINLSGTGIAEKRWTSRRKKELVDSRIVPTEFLASFAPEMKALKQYISASGINCYGYDQPERAHTEKDPFGKDFLSRVVEKWENAADTFKPFCTVAKIRISPALSKKGGLLETITKPMKFGITSALGSGKQWMPWIHIRDLARIFEFVMENRLPGSFNTTGKVVTNQKFTEVLAKKLHKKMWLPNVPEFVLKIVLGEMASVVVDGVNASTAKLKEQGFAFEFEELDAALEDIYSQRK